MSLHKDIEKADIVSKFKSGLENGTFGIDNETGKIFSVSARRNKDAVNWDTPWVFVNNPANYACDWHSQISTLFTCVPRHCQGCWKTVVRPRTLHELIQLYDLQKEMVEKNPECYCKCGIEVRPFVFGNYGGYFYSRSRKEGLERYNEVRALVDEKISPDVTVILKRGCTEFEIAHGDSAQYGVTDEQDYWESIIEETCEIVPYSGVQPPEVVIYVIREWIKHAWNVGDPTVFMYTDGQPLVRPSTTYHDKVDETEVGTPETPSDPETGDANSPDQSETK